MPEDEPRKKKTAANYNCYFLQEETSGLASTYIKKMKIEKRGKLMGRAGELNRS